MMAVTGWRALLYKETLRFWKVGFQTVGAPILTAVLYLMVFGHVLEDHVKVYGQVSYTAFLVPGLAMMSVPYAVLLTLGSLLIWLLYRRGFALKLPPRLCAALNIAK